jgi:CheY-like chemotaxis protein
VTAGGLAVLQSFREHQPDLLLLDVMMPQFNGFTVCQQIRSRDPQARVVLMSGFVASDVPSVASSGALGFIGKPFTFDEFSTLLSSVALDCAAA